MQQQINQMEVEFYKRAGECNTLCNTVDNTLQDIEYEFDEIKNLKQLIDDELASLKDGCKEYEQQINEVNNKAFNLPGDLETRIAEQSTRAMNEAQRQQQMNQVGGMEAVRAYILTHAGEADLRDLEDKIRQLKERQRTEIGRAEQHLEKIATYNRLAQREVAWFEGNLEARVAEADQLLNEYKARTDTTNAEIREKFLQHKTSPLMIELLEKVYAANIKQAEIEKNVKHKDELIAERARLRARLGDHAQ